MRLTDIELGEYGRFLKEPAAFGIERFHLPEAWDYLYTNRRMLLRVRHDGTGYAQLDPPGGTVLHKLERFQVVPSFFLWVKPEGAAAFANFYKPNFSVQDPSREPGTYRCTFAPAKAVFRLRHRGMEVVTEMTVPPDDPAVIMRVTVTNRAARRSVDLIPVWRPHNTSSSLAPWDVPELYQTTQYCNDPHQVIWIETRDPGGIARRRRRAFLMTDMTADTAEVYYGRFVGHGSFPLPQAAIDGRLGIDAAVRSRYGEVGAANAAIAQLPVAAFQKTVVLERDGSFRLTLVLAGLPEQGDGALPPYGEIARYAAYLEPGAFERVCEENAATYGAYASLRRLTTPDEAFNRYVNEWLPLQLRWVTMLDRGWPTGLRGTRDAAQDFTGLIPLFPAEARQVILDIFACQRSDGWFPRQYSVDGPDGRHDLRPYVDAGCWVWELLYDYLCFTGDREILEVQARWLDGEATASVREHAQRIFAYYMDAENLGEHGLVKLRGGDWLDSVNAAGLEGRGETVMVSCQVALACRQAADLFPRIGGDGGSYAAFGARMRESLRRHALNSEGYLNGFFNDAGRWICSPEDPDGRGRIYSPANAFGVLAGIFERDELPTLFERLKTLKQQNGYALFWPGIGDVPIAKLGRIGQGDLLPGVSENGTPYNHASHGFLARAAAAAGRGDLVQDIVKHLLPYDQEAHPVEVAKTAPYGIVNHWASIEGQYGRGGATFLSGTISTAIRMIYAGMLGFQPTLDGIMLAPCLPSGWNRVRYRLSLRGAGFVVSIANPSGVQSGIRSVTLNGKRLGGTTVPFSALRRDGPNRVTILMG